MEAFDIMKIYVILAPSSELGRHIYAHTQHYIKEASQLYTQLQQVPNRYQVELARSYSQILKVFSWSSASQLGIVRPKQSSKAVWLLWIFESFFLQPLCFAFSFTLKLKNQDCGEETKGVIAEQDWNPECKLAHFYFQR